MSDTTTILLHLGTHKTGSTSLQRNFAKHRWVLRKHGLRYVGTDQPYPNLYSAFMPDPMKFVWNRVSGLSREQIMARDAKSMAELEAVLAKNTDPLVVISSEYLAMLPAEGLRAMRDRFAPYGRVEAVYAYRELHSWISSDTQQMAKIGVAKRRTPVNEALRRISDFPVKIVEVFGRDATHFLRFEDAKEIGICTHFLQTFGLPGFPEMGLEESRENLSLSGPAVEALFVYNREHPLEGGTRDPVEVARLRALPGPRYVANAFGPRHIENYAQAWKVATELGLRLAPPETLARLPAWQIWRSRLKRALRL
ncbi:hypothetical protein [Pararhodobacter sp.]|uniref:hypothetical protein n=1 Tax=Pararhodobacter sp. TaxID=2127056 RepID=UPI002AFF6889|nr:hypothetical protein [Pararhodobacter sp.]